MESIGFAIEKGDADLLSTSDSIVADLAPQISDKKLNIIKTYGSDVPHLDIGAKTARIILQNLLANAVRYTPPSGTVEIKIEKNADGVSVSVKDNGYGIPEDAKSRIFTKLFRADNAKEKEPSGTGLGLYLVKSLVDRLGGKIWFESKEGVGSTFYVDLR
jgi:signal transduction histidine kinase